jgi:hypothetical protein
VGDNGLRPTHGSGLYSILYGSETDGGRHRTNPTMDDCSLGCNMHGCDRSTFVTPGFGLCGLVSGNVRRQDRNPGPGILDCLPCAFVEMRFPGSGVNAGTVLWLVDCV